MRFETWLLFLVASAGLSLTPGPNSLLVLTHGALHGRRKASFTIAGGVLGFVVLIALCMFGIGALLETSILWLRALKWAGGIYLVWLGIDLWRSPPISLEVSAQRAKVPNGSLFRKGFLSATTNPKGLLFFTAFLPLFLDPHRGMASQFAVLAGTYAATEFLVESAIASAANRIRPWLRRVGRRFNRVCGGIFVVIGSALPLHS